MLLTKFNRKNFVEFGTLDLSQPRHAYTAVLLVRAIAHWLKETYRACIVQLLIIVNKDLLGYVARYIFYQRSQKPVSLAPKDAT